MMNLPGLWSLGFGIQYTVKDSFLKLAISSRPPRTGVVPTSIIKSLAHSCTGEVVFVNPGVLCRFLCCAKAFQRLFYSLQRATVQPPGRRALVLIRSRLFTCQSTHALYSSHFTDGYMEVPRGQDLGQAH